MSESIPAPKPKKAVKLTAAETHLRQQAIGVRLRTMFDEVVREPVPDSFLDILRRADAEGRNGRQ
jgi:Anti-sigma factor NepR